MAAHRYWRAVGLEAYGAGDLELSCFHLLAAGVRVDAAATLTANTAPDVSGALANLQDDVLATAARWSARAVKTLALQWDFADSPADVDDLQLAGDSEGRFLLIAKIQYSDNTAYWTDLPIYAGLAWPGAGAKTQKIPAEFRYWRLYITANNGDAFTGLQEVELCLEPGGYDITTPGMQVTQSSNAAQDNAAGWKAFDNGLADAGLSSWVAAPGVAPPHWVAIDLGAPAMVANVRIWPQNYLGGPARAPRDFKIQGSNDSAEWVDVAEFYGISGWAEGVSKSFSFSPASGIYRNKVRGRATPTDVVVMGAGPAMTYGTPFASEPINLSVPSGAVKDYLTGVLGQGIGRVRGTVKLKNDPVNTPLKRRVRLERERDGLQIRETWSDPGTGAYDFRFIDELQVWVVKSYDHTHDKRAVIADGLSLANGGVELMP